MSKTRDPAAWLAALTVALGLLFPIILFAWQGLSLAGISEESTGYRYFYTLRMLYGEHERPWLPQGHLVGLVHIALQLLLTAIGYPPTQLSPRIDLFIYLAAALPHLATAAAFLCAARPLATALQKFTLAALLVALSFAWTTGAGSHLIQPDYLSWVGAVSLLTLGWLLRLLRDPHPANLRQMVQLGLFAGLALAIKPTYLVFPLTIGALLLAHSWGPLRLGALSADGTSQPIQHSPSASLPRVLAWGLTSLVLALLVWGLTVWAYYLGDLAASLAHWPRLIGFVGEVGSPERFHSWLLTSTLQGHVDITVLSLMLLPILGLSLFLLPRPAASLSLLVGLVASGFVAYERFYPATLIETNAYFLVASTVWTVAAFSPWAASVTKRARPALLTWPGGLVVKCAAILAIVGLVVSEAVQFWIIHQPVLNASSAASARLNEFLAEGSGRTLFLIPDNDARPITVDSAIQKGGTDLGRGGWGDSRFVEAMVPDRSYALDTPNLRRPLDLYPFEKLVFVSPAADRAAALERLASVFGITTVAFDCSFEASHLAITVVGSGDWRFQENVLTGCRRRQDVLADGAENTATYLTTAGTLAPQVPLTASLGESTTLVPGDLIYAGDSGELFRMEPEGGFVRLSGYEGQLISVGNIGPWDDGTKQLAGLGAAYRAGRWMLYISGMEPVNRDPRFADGTSRDPLAGRWVTPGDAGYRVVRRQDEGGRFVHVTATRPSDHLLVTASDPLERLDGVPVSLRGRVRGRPGTILSLGLHDTLPDSARVSTERSLTSGDWTTMVARSGRVEHPNPGDNYTIGLVSVEAGDWFDVQELSLFVGILPTGDFVLPSTPSFELPADPRDVIAFSVPGDSLVVRGTPVLSPTGATTRLEVGDVAWIARTGELLRLAPIGPPIRLVGQEGWRVQIPNLGEWDAQLGRFRGAQVIFQSGQWALDTSMIRAANRNSLFLEAGRDGSLPGWSVTPPDAGYEIARLQDEEGPFVRIQATRPSSHLQLLARAPLFQLDGVPVSLRGQIRSHGAGTPILAVYDFGADGTARVTDNRSAPANTWTTLTVRLDRVAQANWDDSFALGLSGVAAGDWFDVREFSLFVGAIP